ncbi:MAG: hypothetical protein R3F19_34105 [Verrucomicrobiales bacterium]
MSRRRNMPWMVVGVSVCFLVACGQEPSGKSQSQPDTPPSPSIELPAQDVDLPNTPAMQVELIESYRLAGSLADSDPLRNETYRKVGGQLRELLASLNGDHEAIATALQGFVDQGADPSFLRTFLHFLSRSDPKFAAANIDVIKDVTERNDCAHLISENLFKAGELEFAEKWIGSALKGVNQFRGRERLIDALIKAGKIENAVGQWELMDPTLRRRATRSLFEAFAKKDLASTIKIVESSSANDFGPASDGLLATLNSSAEIENALAMASNDTLRSELANKIVSIDTKADATVADTVTSATTLASRLGVELDGVLAKALMAWTNKNALATADYMLQHGEDAPLASKKFEPYFNSAVSRPSERSSGDGRVGLASGGCKTPLEADRHDSHRVVRPRLEIFVGVGRGSCLGRCQGHRDQVYGQAAREIRGRRQCGPMAFSSRKVTRNHPH